MFMVDGGALKCLDWMMVYFAGSEVDGNGYPALVGYTGFISCCEHRNGRSAYVVDKMC
jgi:hypothetical protein